MWSTISCIFCRTGLKLAFCSSLFLVTSSRPGNEQRRISTLNRYWYLCGIPSLKVSFATSHSSPHRFTMLLRCTRMPFSRLLCVVAVFYVLLPPSALCSCRHERVTPLVITNPAFGHTSKYSFCHSVRKTWSSEGVANRSSLSFCTCESLKHQTTAKTRLQRVAPAAPVRATITTPAVTARDVTRAYRNDGGRLDPHVLASTLPPCSTRLCPPSDAAAVPRGQPASGSRSLFGGPVTSHG